MINKIEHIGIAVSNIEEAIKTYEDVLENKCYKTEIVNSEHVKTAFIKVGDSKIELLQATSKESPIAKFISKKGEGIHHIAFDTDNILSEIKRLTKKGYQLINEQPKLGADNKKIVFLHPKETNKVLIELCEERK